jgi:hypothetical protein
VETSRWREYEKIPAAPPNYQAAIGGSKYAYNLVSKTCWPNAATAPLCNAPLPTTPATIPDHIFFDRVYMHGDDKHDIIEGIQAAFSWFAVVDSYISDIHAPLKPICEKINSPRARIRPGPGPGSPANNRPSIGG